MVEMRSTAHTGTTRSDELAVNPGFGRKDQIIVLANRQPYSHDYDEQGQVVLRHSNSGVVHAVEPLLSACSGVWVGHGAGRADRTAVEQRDGLDVPPERPAYRLRRVWLNPTEERGYYDGFANEGLWPLCHRVYVQPTFRVEDYHAYRAVNERFADAVADEADTSSPVVLVQDYHFALAPHLIRKRLPRSVIVSFWHIPWPHWQSFEVCPWHSELLEGLLGSDILGFQTPSDCMNFMEAVAHTLEADVDPHRSVIRYGDRRVAVRAYPVSIDWPGPSEGLCPPIDVCRREVRQSLGLKPDVQLGVGVDRLDYTKGLEEKFGAIERLFERYADFRESFAFVQLAQPTRVRLPVYRDLRSRLKAAVDRINQRFGSAANRPMTVIEGDHAPGDVFRYLRAADLCHIASLQDGMNLVSKEFVSARDDEQGVLILSRFAGSARELSGALLVNPLDSEEMVETLAQALRMDRQEQRRRMRIMRSVVAESNASRWAEQMLSDAARVRYGRWITQPAPTGDRSPARASA